MFRKNGDDIYKIVNSIRTYYIIHLETREKIDFKFVVEY